MGRPTVWYSCDTLKCDGEFYARWEENNQLLYLCNRCYSRKYRAKKRLTTICNKRGCPQKVQCVRAGYYHCRPHHNEMFHVMTSPLYISKEDCGCLAWSRGGWDSIDNS